ncbi:NAD(P)-dependent dehydrogenase (short-subunit alcohol dehydrogenase family) [Saccharothrix tamanrassetensis]|uniref:NAD(P)-dependent dehydrogenase (Short-subunit alcohol dehydrogenase family) n=1 Tax=Saccharothrix tamanrassetensis TaxID=1051531 RepID=A0A841CMP0_9PSEU|nr:SDR family NAD(P)-dependent oxidoreductase [Saccharothrix tamanrassetensis]MBB5958390.1 NAD(P)-dependent dehydrogenase (short-subunit alcohol dehydrogenase family) [Saccharothrix tamanrassetensis]
MEFEGRVALITGGANGIGEGVARRLAGLGARVLVADVDAVRGQAVADDIGGAFVSCDVRDPRQSEAAVAEAVRAFGGLDIVVLNAGIATGFGLGDDFDPERYRSVMGINLDGVVYGVHAALPELKKRGGHIIATASMAGLMAMPLDPLYGANKAAVVALVRALGPVLAADGVTVNAVCPSFADTAIISGFKSFLESSGMPVLTVDEVVDAYLAVLRTGGTGECWYVQAGRPSEPFKFPNPPGPRTGSGARVTPHDPSQEG